MKKAVSELIFHIKLFCSCRCFSISTENCDSCNKIFRTIRFSIKKVIFMTALKLLVRNFITRHFLFLVITPTLKNQMYQNLKRMHLMRPCHLYKILFQSVLCYPWNRWQKFTNLLNYWFICEIIYLTFYWLKSIHTRSIYVQLAQVGDLRSFANYPLQVNLGASI